MKSQQTEQEAYNWSSYYKYKYYPHNNNTKGIKIIFLKLKLFVHIANFRVICCFFFLIFFFLSNDQDIQIKKHTGVSSIFLKHST